MYIKYGCQRYVVCGGGFSLCGDFVETVQKIFNKVVREKKAKVMEDKRIL